MAKPIIKYSESTGSDTAASGMGPATAVTGTTAAHTNGASSTTIVLADGPDLTGVVVDDTIWLDTPAGGRHLTQILATNTADTVFAASGTFGSATHPVETITSSAGEVFRIGYYLKKTDVVGTILSGCSLALVDVGDVSLEGFYSRVNSNTGAFTVVLSVGGPYTAADMSVTSVDVDWWYVEHVLTDAAGTAVKTKLFVQPLDSSGSNSVDRSSEVWNATFTKSDGTQYLSFPFDLTQWSAASVTVTPDTSQPPPIQVDADTLSGGAGVVSNIRTGSIPISSSLNAPFTFETYLRKEATAVTELRFLAHILDAGFAAVEQFQAWIDTNTGVVRLVSGSVTAGGTPYDSSDITVTSVDADWWHVSMRLVDYGNTAVWAKSTLYPYETGGTTVAARDVVLWGSTAFGADGINFFAYPNDLSNAAWTTATGATITPNTHLAPAASERTIEVEDTFTIAVGSAVDYAIGGKRKTLTADATNNDIDDAKAGWTYELDEGDYVCADNGAHIFQNLPGSLADGPTTVRAATGAATKPVLSWTSDFYLFVASTEFLKTQNIRLENTTSTSTNAIGIRAVGASRIESIDCEIECPFGVSPSGGASLFMVRSKVTSSQWSGIELATGASAVLLDCDLSDSLRDGLLLNTQDDTHVVMDGCRLRDNGRYGLRVNIVAGTGSSVVVKNGAVYSNINHGIAVTGTPSSDSFSLSVPNTIFSENGGYGIHSDNPIDLLTYADYNAFYANTSGARNNISAGDNDVTLTADPYVNAAAGDFTLNGTVGGGVELFRTGLGYPN